ncbi:hypothetical protein FLP41_14275 [Paracoccus marcusii]|uniref:hypothetical protein n=1 Tax=Paracoccus marcusii TaxID=59779 RepID=UPI002ED55D76|nr:hypothetical protein FLP41_14275 [Paracoccus marcusii]
MKHFTTGLIFLVRTSSASGRLLWLTQISAWEWRMQQNCFPDAHSLVRAAKAAERSAGMGGSLLNRDHIIGTAAGLAGVEPDTAERIVDLFTIDLDNLDGSGAGEGFPPFLRIGDALLFSPHAVKRTMPERNLLYAMVRTDKKRFDNVVSSHLEPALLEEVARYLSALPGVEVTKNVHWEKGEIDLIAYHEASNSAFQLQAKAGCLRRVRAWWPKSSRGHLRRRSRSGGFLISAATRRMRFVRLQLGGRLLA